MTLMTTENNTEDQYFPETPRFSMAEKAKLDYLNVPTDLPPARTMPAAMIEMVTLLCSVMIEQTVADMIERSNKSLEQPS